MKEEGYPIAFVQGNSNLVSKIMGRKQKNRAEMGKINQSQLVQ